jgi:hypothetical protein
MTAPWTSIKVSSRTPRSVRLKLERFQEHMDSLDEVIRTFLEGEPYAAGRRVEAGGTEHVLYWERYVDPPDRLGLIAGDAVHNLRSSLDHLVVALAQAGAACAGGTLTAEEEAGLQFPVATTPQGFAAQVQRRLLHVDPRAQAVIEARQPYNNCGSGDPKRSLLWQLSDRDNADKHRALTVAGLSTGIVSVNWPPELRQTPFSQPPVIGRPSPGTEIGRHVFPGPRSEAEVPVECRWGFVLWIGHFPFVDVRYTLTDWASVVAMIVTELSDGFL